MTDFTFNGLKSTSAGQIINDIHRGRDSYSAYVSPNETVTLYAGSIVKIDATEAQTALESLISKSYAIEKATVTTPVEDLYIIIVQGISSYSYTSQDTTNLANARKTCTIKKLEKCFYTINVAPVVAYGDQLMLDATSVSANTLVKYVDNGTNVPLGIVENATTTTNQIIPIKAII